MTRFVALWRGINVGKAKRLAMADLRALLERLGYTDVRTLLNSGNAVFAGKGAAASHGKRIRAAVADELGVDAAVLVRRADEVRAIVGENSLADPRRNPSRVLAAVADPPGSLEALAPLARSAWKPEALHVGAHAAWIWCPDGVLQSALVPEVTRALGGAVTMRNQATFEKLVALLDTLDG
ncbi:MAG: DUF1697 domain-containing protein [Planctomycetes bacterium]|nr:DUF1697 domain-containing protein [Planctomycetota bacterium]